MDWRGYILHRQEWRGVVLVKLNQRVHVISEFPRWPWSSWNMSHAYICEQKGIQTYELAYVHKKSSYMVRQKRLTGLVPSPRGPHFHGNQGRCGTTEDRKTRSFHMNVLGQDGVRPCYTDSHVFLLWFIATWVNLVWVKLRDYAIRADSIVSLPLAPTEKEKTGIIFPFYVLFIYPRRPISKGHVFWLNLSLLPRTIGVLRITQIVLFNRMFGHPQFRPGEWSSYSRKFMKCVYILVKRSET